MLSLNIHVTTLAFYVQVFDCFLIFEVVIGGYGLIGYEATVSRMLLMYGFIIRALYSSAEDWDAMHRLVDFPGLQSVSYDNKISAHCLQVSHQ